MNLAEDKSFRSVKEMLAIELDKWMNKQGDPGEEIDSEKEFENARKGEHFNLKTSSK